MKRFRLTGIRSFYISYEALRALEQVLQESELPASSRVSEAQAAYRTKKQGEHTLEDYYRLLEERRVELKCRINFPEVFDSIRFLYEKS